jgi:oligoendopeptidase F
MNVAQGDILPGKRSRKFLPEEFSVSSWEHIEPYFQLLDTRSINDLPGLEEWLMDLSELQSVFQENQAWRYIHMTGDTANVGFEQEFNYFASRLEPLAAPYFNAFHTRLVASPFCKLLPIDKYAIFLRSIKQEMEIYRKENIPLLTEIEMLSQEYARIIGGITVVIHDKEMTLQQASNLFKNTDRNLREQTYQQVRTLRLAARPALNNLFDQLVSLRHKVALNAGFENFRDFCFAALGRFDYGPEECFMLHDSVSAELVPLIEEFDKNRKEALKLDRLRPWDTEVDLSGRPPLTPFGNADDLIRKTIECFNLIHPDFGNYIRIMNKMGHFDLDSRKGKAPGGYNYHLPETGVPFIFMNSVGSLRDLVTMVHEGGHAVHSFLCRDLLLKENKDVPSEIAELASMSMELLSMEHWEVFFNNEEDLKRAKLEQLEKVLRSLPWICLVDKFQHWIYEHPFHTQEQRSEQWRNLSASFESSVLDWTGLEDGRESEWQKQLHLYEVPFYYIEYAFAQLGAIAVWRNYKLNPSESIRKYREALSLGYTRTIAELYEAAGVNFEFSRTYVKELADFVKMEIQKLGE